MVLCKFIKQLLNAYSAIKSVKGIKFISSSLLLVYDAFLENPVLKLIDFENAKQTQDDESDGYVLEGISNLCKVLHEIEKSL